MLLHKEPFAKFVSSQPHPRLEVVISRCWTLAQWSPVQLSMPPSPHAALLCPQVEDGFDEPPAQASQSVTLHTDQANSQVGAKSMDKLAANVIRCHFKVLASDSTA
eukprot:scaffold89814_cov16-Prasinocladus_malaysianus.AAC.1